MMRDRGPNHSLGFGVTQGQLPIDEVTETPDPQAGIIARALNESPVAKFFATAGATIVGAAVSGSLVRRAGVRGLRAAAQRAARDPNSTSAGFIKEYRKVQSIFDDYGGIERIRRTSRMDIEGGKVVHFDDPGLDKTYKGDSFVFNMGERERMRGIGGELPAEWSLKDELQQQSVRAARRLPYELPAVYVTQRAFTDKLLDEGADQPVNWSNPVDIIGDFANQSMKNVALAFAPFTAGGASVQHGWRKALTTSVDQAAPAGRRAMHNTIIDINDSLDLIGQEASDLLAKASRVSNRSMGAASTAISQTASRQQSITQTMHSMRHGEGGFTGWLNRVRTGEEVFGPVSQIRDMTKNYRTARSSGRDALDDTYTNVYGGGSGYEDISSSIRNLQGADGDGAFYQALAAAEYKKIMSRQLSDMGVDKTVSQEFSNVANFTLPIKSDQKTHLSKRIMFGKRAGGKIDEGSGAWTEAFRERVEPVYRGHGQSLSGNIERALRATDKEFLALKPHIDQKIGRAWSSAHRETIAPEAARMLGTRRAAFSEFGDNMTPGSAEFLVRRSAERAGIETTTAFGGRVSTSDLKSRLAAQGLDPSNKQRLRSFLVEQGDISKPWNASGRNLFGLRPMSIQEGLDKKVFGQDVKDIDQLAKTIARSDWDPNILNRVKAGGLYETASGKVADFNPLKRGARNVMDKFATEVEVPVLHFNPLQMVGYQARREAAQRGAIQFTTGRQPFTGAAGRDADGFFWFQQKHSKGRVAAFRMGADGGRAQTTFLDGSYRPFAADQSMTGRALHLAAGDNVGRAGVQREGFWGNIADRLDIDPYQPGSIGGGIRRMAPEHRQDIRNVGAYARQARDGGSDPFASFDPATAAEGGRNFLNQLRGSSLTRNITRALGGRSRLHRMTSIEEAMPPGVYGPGRMVDVFDMDAATLRRHARNLADENPASLGITDDALAKVFMRSQGRIKKLADTENLASLDQTLHRMARTPTMNQKIDEARMDMIRHLTARDSLRRGQSPSDLRKSLGDIADEIGGLQGRGVISSREAAESRAALGGIEAHYLNLRTDPLLSSQNQTRDVIDRLLRSESGVGLNESMQKILDDAANYGTAGRLAGKARKHLAPGKYRFDGTEYNPFGASTILTPTFGTAFNRNPLKATLSAMGVKTWDDPDSFSGAGIGVSHVFDRMNRATQVLGLGVDSAKYSGPLDMFHRGMLAKRVLPIVAGGTTAMALDRTAGGYVHNEQDAYGERVYKPLVMGAVGELGMEAHATMAGLIPGGMGYQEKKDELLHGDVAIRRGRWWPFGNTPFKGGQVDYYRPSWYRRLQEGYQYTSQTYGSPMERLMFGHDFSPLRPLDPYRFEREHYEDRPYPETGDYFTGPWGPATGVLNMTLGRVLKPRKQMHEDELQWEMSRFQQVGAHGMAPPSTGMAMPGEPTVAGALAGSSGGTVMSDAPYTAAAGSPAYLSGSKQATQDAYGVAGYYAAAAKPWYTAPREYPFASDMQSTTERRPSNVVMASEPISTGGVGYQASETAYLMQEYSGIYGFAFGAVRETLGLGSMEFESDRPVLAQAGQAYGTGRQFWDLGLGGLGDLPTPAQGMGGLELSELVRRFIPKPRRQDYINPIRNRMGIEQPWLPGDEYFTNFHTGDPYTEITEGEMRLPGQGYERFNELHPDETGRYGRIDRFRILSDVAPYSNEFRAAAAELRNMGMSQQEQGIYEETMLRVEERKRKHEFTPYEHKYESGFGGAAEAWERFKHMDTYFHKKLLPDATAIEDWERNNIYGSSFPEWQCLDTETEVLTQEGWKKYQELKEIDILWTADPECGLGEWAEIEAINSYRYSGPMYSFDGRTINALVTPNHRWLSTSQRKGYKDFYFRTTEDLNTSDYIPRALPSKDIKEEVWDDAFVQLIGWIVTDGTYSRYGIHISQSPVANAKKCKRIEEMLAALNLPLHRYERRNPDRCFENSYSIYGEYAKDIKNIFPNKRLTIDFVNGLSLRQKLLLVETIILGDGSDHSNVKGQRLGVFDKDEIPVFSILFAQAGISFSLKEYDWVDRPDPNGNVHSYTEYRFELHSKRFWRYAKHVPEIVDYDGIVWCPTTKNGTILIKRNGKTTWTGNSPIESFVKPAVYKATDKNPIRAGIGLAVFGHLFGATPRARAAGRLIGGVVGAGSSAFGRGHEAITGERYIPQARKEEMAIEEYTDILEYTRALRGFNLAQEHGDFKAVEQFRDQMKSTMYGVDLFDSTPEEMARAVPKRKREHFTAMLQAPEQERERILSTAGRLERRMYQAHWGLNVERRPDLGEYFEQNELPGPEWEGWDPRTDMNQVEIKMLQRQGLNASQMGYYPQQVSEANLVNPSFPEFGGGSPNARAQLERLMSRRGMRSDIREIRTPFPGVRVQMNSGV